MFNALVQLPVKTTFSGCAPKNSATVSLVKYICSAVFIESLWPLLPGFPPYIKFALSMALETISGFG